jgi:cbb3-type cytochrome oxidase subunit 3
MIKRLKWYQRVVLFSLCVALLTLTLSLFSLGMHYVYLNSTYQAIVNEEQNKILDEVSGLTIKEAIDKGYGPQIQLLLQPRNENISAISKVDQLYKLESYAWFSGLMAIIVLFVLGFVYWYARKRIIKTIKRDLDSVLTQVRSVISGVDLKDQKVILDILPLVIETMGYRGLAGWIRKALTPIDLNDSNP